MRIPTRVASTSHGKNLRVSCFPCKAAFFRATRPEPGGDRKSTRLNSSHLVISYAVFCLKKKKITHAPRVDRPMIRLLPRARRRVRGHHTPLRSSARTPFSTQETPLPDRAPPPTLADSLH